MKGGKEDSEGDEKEEEEEAWSGGGQTRPGSGKRFCQSCGQS